MYWSILPNRDVVARLSLPEHERLAVLTRTITCSQNRAVRIPWDECWLIWYAGDIEPIYVRRQGRHAASSHLTPERVYLILFGVVQTPQSMKQEAQLLLPKASHTTQSAARLDFDWSCHPRFSHALEQDKFIMVSYVLEGTAGLAVGSPAELPLRLWALFDVRHLLRWQHCVGRRPHVTNDLNCDLLRGALPKEELIRLRSGARAREPCQLFDCSHLRRLNIMLIMSLRCYVLVFVICQLIIVEISSSFPSQSCSRPLFEKLILQ